MFSIPARAPGARHSLDRVSEIADSLIGALLRSSEEALRQIGEIPLPQVHILAEDMKQAYFGYLQCRPFYRGADAASAIATLGYLPAVLAATRLVVLWEDADIRTALELPGEGFARGIVALDARFDGHTLHWHPFDVEVGRPRADGKSAVVRMRRPEQYEDVELLAPVAELVRIWRESRPGEADDIRRVVAELQEAGYRLFYWGDSAD
jgi:hypothetical protein